MLSTKRETLINFYSKDLYDTVKIPLRDKLLELTNSTELAILLNQIVYSNKDKLTLNQIKKLSLNEKTKQTIRTKLNKLVELGFLVKEKNTKLIFNQYLYSPTEKAFFDDTSIIALIEGTDLKNNPNYLRAAIINKFRSYALDGITEVHISANKLNNMLGADYSESTVRNILRDLCREDYISADISYGVYNYKINLDKINNIINPEQANIITNEIISIYKEYLNRINVGYNKNQIDSYIMTFKRMILDGYDYNCLKHIITYITINFNEFKELLTPATIKKSYDNLKKLSEKLSKRKASRFLYKLNNNLLEKEKNIIVKKQENNTLVVSPITKEPEPISDENSIWLQTLDYLKDKEKLIKKWYFDTVIGVTDIDFEDFYQQALYITYKFFKDKKEFSLNTLKLRLKDFMFKKRNTFEKLSEDENNIVNFIDYQEDEYKLPIDLYNNDKDLDEDKDNNTINSILDLLDERSRFVVVSYFGFDGHSLTLKEIGNKLNLSESFVSRIYKKAIMLLKEHLPPNFEKIIRNLFNENKSFIF